MDIDSDLEESSTDTSPVKKKKTPSKNEIMEQLQDISAQLRSQLNDSPRRLFKKGLLLLTLFLLFFKKPIARPGLERPTSCLANQDFFSLCIFQKWCRWMLTFF